MSYAHLISTRGLGFKFSLGLGNGVMAVIDMVIILKITLNLFNIDCHLMSLSCFSVCSDKTGHIEEEIVTKHTTYAYHISAAMKVGFRV